MQITITNAGLAAIVNAQNNGTAPLTVSQVGVTAASFTPAASLTALPGEIKRVTTFAGQAVADDTIHVTIRDDSADAYSLRGFGLYFSDGTLFAIYGQPGVILEKSTQATLLMAGDIRFAQIDATSITFGDSSFSNPPATDTVQGIVELATNTETDTGTDAQRAVTPAGVKYAFDQRFGTGAPSAFIKTLLTLATSALFRTALEIKSAALRDEGAGNGLDADKVDGQHGAFYLAWSNFTGVPATFPPSTHGHIWTDISGKPTSFPPSAHSHGDADITSLSWAKLSGIPAFAARWPSWDEVSGKPGAFPPTGHGHAISDISGLQGSLNAKADLTGASFSGGISAPTIMATSSDARLKDDIADLRDCLGKVRQLRPRSWRWKRTGESDFGFIAQEHREVIPEAVHEDMDGMLFVRYAKAEALIVGAVQELAARLDAIEARLIGQR